MPQTSTWYERNRVVPIPTPTSPAPTQPRQTQPAQQTGSSWYEQNRVTPIPTPTTRPIAAPVQRTPTPPPAPTARGTQVAPSIPTKPSILSRVGSRLYDMAEGMYNLSPLGQTASAQRAVKDPAKLKAALPEFEQQLKDVQRSPVKQFETAANLLDPTGTIGGYTALGRQGVEDWRNQDYAGLGVDVGVASLPLAGYGLSRLIGGVRNKALLPQAPKVGVVPPAGEIVKRTKPAWDFNAGTTPVAEPFAPASRSQGIFSVAPAEGTPGYRGVDKKRGTTTKNPNVGEVVARPPAGAGKYRLVKVEVVDPLTGEVKTVRKRIPKNASPEIESAVKHGKISGTNELGTEDFLGGDPLYATVPNRLRPEAPNVTRLRATSEGAGRTGQVPSGSRLEFIDQATHDANVAAAKAAEEAAAKNLRPGTAQILKNPTPEKIKELRAAGWRVTHSTAKKNVDGKVTSRTVYMTYEPKVDPKTIVKPGAPSNIEELVAKLKEKEGGTVTPKAGPPTVAGAIRAIPGRIRQKVRDSRAYELYKPIGLSTETELRRMGPIGNAIANLLKEERTATNTFGGNQLAKTRQVLRTTSKAEQAEIIDIMNGDKSVADASSQKVADSYRLLRESTEELANEAIAAKLTMKNSRGEVVPFQKHAGEYFPHNYDDKLFKDLKSLEEKLLADPRNAPNDVAAIMKNIREKGERFSSARHSRDIDLPGWRKDLGSLEKHQLEMAEAITQAKKYGNDALGDPNSKLSQMIKAAENEESARKLVTHALDRGPQMSQGARKAYNFVTGGIAATKLSLQAITNLSDLAGAASNVGVRSTAKAILKTLTSPHKSADYATKVGSLNILRKQLLHETSGGKFLTKLYGTNATEKFVRSVESLAGRDEVQKAFAKAKAKPGKGWEKRLSHFLDDDIDTLMRQDKLTEDQLQRASGRAAEISSGIPDKLSLGSAFHSDNVYVKLALLLKRFAFLNTKNMVEAFNSAPNKYQATKKIATILTAYAAMGEATGDVKAAIKGFVAGDIEKAVSERGDTIGTGNEAFDRIMANYLQSALFGLIGDASESIAKRTTGKFSGLIGGPVVSDIDEALTAGADWFAEDRKSSMFGGRASGVEDKLGKTKEALIRRTPFFGAGLQERLYPKESGNKFRF